MKTEINLENKAKFFAQYWGVNVMHDDSKYGINTYDVGYLDDGREYHWLGLKPVHLLSREDADVVGHIIDYDLNEQYKRAIISEHLIEGRLFPFKVIDYLRSKGYALPWLDLSVEEMVEAGWVKLSI